MSQLLPAPGQEWREARLRAEACVDRDAIRRRNRCLIRGYFEVSTYRGQPCVVCGYMWQRPQSHRLHGTVYTSVLARGADWREALLRAEGAKARSEAPTPWALSASPFDDSVQDADSVLVASEIENDGVRQRIIRAVNAHDALVEALRVAQEILNHKVTVESQCACDRRGGMLEELCEDCACLQKIGAALRLAEGGQ